MSLINGYNHSLITAIRLSGVDRFEELLSLIGQFVIQERLREAHDLYVCLMDRFPNAS